MVAQTLPSYDERIIHPLLEAGILFRHEADGCLAVPVQLEQGSTSLIRIGQRSHEAGAMEFRRVETVVLEGPAPIPSAIIEQVMRVSADIPGLYFHVRQAGDGDFQLVARGWMRADLDGEGLTQFLQSTLNLANHLPEALRQTARN